MSTPLRADEIPDVTEPMPPHGLPEDRGLERVVLNVGCGYPLRQQLHPTFQGPGWREIRHDVDPASHPDIVCPLTELGAVSDGSVDAVWSSHNLVHLYRHQVPQALSAFLRVLRPRGLLLVTVLDLRQIAEFVASDRLDQEIYRSPSGPITALDMIYGHAGSIGRGSAAMAHKSGFTATTLGQLLIEAGFIDVVLSRRDFDLTAHATKPSH